MKILSWNIQATKGCDDRYDLTRIVDVINTFGDVDVICLQEVSRYIDVYNGNDQKSEIAARYPEHEVVWAPGFSLPGKASRRSEFGNLSLVRKPLLVNARTHSLPCPQVRAKQIPRTAAETVVQSKTFTVSIFNAHLAFHSSTERVAQIQALTRLRDETISRTSNEPQYSGAGAFQHPPISQAVLLCGDLNVSLESKEFSTHIIEQGWVDCWHAQNFANQDEPPSRSPTCGCFDRVLWPEGPHIRDFFLGTENLSARTLQVTVNTETDASDHQPLLMEIEV